jgi:two-component system, LytTR family, sensor histidine kinase AlgZ
VLVHLSGHGLFSEVYAAAVPLFLGMGTVIFVAVAFVHYLLIAWREAAEADRRALELAVLAREAELKALKMQLAPHFLFNSLNSISALTGSSPRVARDMCLLLASFLRKSLMFGAMARITLEEEISLIADFLAIEQVRFGSRLRVQTEVADDVRTCRLPPLLLQPLLENSVIHGVSDLLEGGTVSISAVRAGSRVSIRISNPFDPDSSNRRHGTGLGIENVRRRLKTTFGPEGRLDVYRQAEIFQVVMTFPLENERETSSLQASTAR